MVHGTSLRILGLVSSDSGVYQCIGRNAAGSVQAAAQLRVHTKGGEHYSILSSLVATLIHVVARFIHRRRYALNSQSGN
jgi:hypothetical protein